MKKIVLAAAAAAAAATAALFSTAASAEITWTHNAGGFVGKGDVQVPLGMSNEQLQSSAGTLTFAYHENRSYTLECFRMEESSMGTGRNKVKISVPVDRDFARVDNIQQSVTFLTRNGKKQITGFNVAGISLPPIVAQCPGGWELDVTDDVTGAAQDPVKNVVRSNGQLQANGTPLPTYVPAYN